MFYKICRMILRFIMFFAFRFEFNGQENIPETGGVILAYNHRSNWDPVIAGLSSKRPLTFMAKEELFKNPFFGALIKKLGAFPIHRGKGDIGAVKVSLSILKQGKCMLMFPEGHRIKNGKKVKAKPGVALIAHRAQVKIIPAQISGEYKWMNKITVTYGEPITLEKYYDSRLEPEKIQEIADGVLDTIRSLNEFGNKAVSE